MEENQSVTQKPQELQPQAPQKTDNTSGLKSKWPFLLIAVLLVLVGVFGSYFVLNQTKNQGVTPTPPPPNEPSVKGTLTPTPEEEKMETKTFTSAKFADLSFKGYELSYPADWSLSEERSELPTPISTLTLTKNGYTLKIFQAATGGAMCVYEGEMPEGPASDYRNNEYKDLTSFATLRQTESLSNGKITYVYCQKSESEDSFGQPTSVGHMSLSTNVANPDPKIISEIEEIVESIKTL